MRIPVPNNNLVAFTLAGALLTAVVAGSLAVPGVGLGPADEQSDSSGTSASQEVGSDAPTPNQEFTPAVQAQSGDEGEEHEEYEEHEEEYEEEDEHEEEDEYEEYGADE